MYLHQCYCKNVAYFVMAIPIQVYVKGGGAATTAAKHAPYMYTMSRSRTAQGGHPICLAFQGRSAVGASQSRALQ